METKHNKYIAVEYKLYTADGGTETLEEETRPGQPFQFISGFGTTLEKFESNIAPLATGDHFDFTLTKDEAYGDREDSRVLNLNRDMFCVNGHFDHENIYKDAIVPLQNEDGNRFYGHVLDIKDDTVIMDLNHPLAGKALHFTGLVSESREATTQEIQAMLAHISGEGCHCHGDDCGCGSDNCHCGENDCHCGDDCHSGEHHHDCGCGHCHSEN